MQGGRYQAAFGFLGTEKMMTSKLYFGVPQKAMMNLFIPLNQCAAKVHNDSLQQDFLRDFLNVTMNNHTRIQLNWQTCYHRVQAGLDCQRVGLGPARTAQTL